MNKKIVVLVLLLLLSIGSFLRFNGISWGYPYLLHPDEGFIVNRAISMVENGTFEAPGYETPGNIIKKVSSVAYKAFSSLYYHTSFFSSQIDVTNRAIYYIITRCISALFGSLTILLAYYIGRYKSKTLGIIMASLFSIFPIFIEHAHYGVPDITVTFFVCLVILFGLEYTQHNTYFNISLISLATALGTVEKFPVVFSFGMIALVVILYNYKTIKELIKQGLLAIFVYIFTIILISPNLFLNFNNVYSQVVIENRSSHLGADGLSWGGNLLFYIQTFINNGGILLFVFGIIGLIYLIFIKKEKQNVVFTCGFIYWLLLSSRGLHWERWGMPMYAAFLFVAAFGVYFLITQKSTMWKKIVLYICLVLCSTNLILSSVKNSVYFTTTDTRVASIDYIGKQGMNKDNTIYDGYTPLYPTGPAYITDTLAIKDGELYIQDLGKQFAIESSQMSSRFNAEPDRYVGQISMYNALKEKGELLANFSPVLLRRSIFEIKNVIYSINDIYQLTNGYSGPTINCYDISRIKSFKSYTFKDNKWLTNGKDIDGTRIIYPGGLSYGPYANLNTGKYSMIIYGEHLKEVIPRLTTDNAINTVEFSITEQKETFIRLEFDLHEYVENFEVLVPNNLMENVILKSLTIKSI